MVATLFSVALALVSVLHVRAESHSIMFKNNCGKGTPQLIQGGNVLSNGSVYTNEGPIQSSIAYLQTGECGLNGENCLTVEMNMNNPACPGCGSSVDLSLIPPHAFVVETAFQFFGGDGSTCDGLGADCADDNCDTAFFQPNDNQVQRACQIDNVNLLITFCGEGTTQFTEAVTDSLSGILSSPSSGGGSTSSVAAAPSSPAASSPSPAAPSSPAASSPAVTSPSPAASSPAASSPAASSPAVSSPTAASDGDSGADSSSAPALNASAPAPSSTSTTKTCKRRRSLPSKRATSFKRHARSQRLTRDLSGVHGSF